MATTTKDRSRGFDKARKTADEPTLFVTGFDEHGDETDSPEAGGYLRITGGGFEPGQKVWVSLKVPDGDPNGDYQSGPIAVSPDGTFADGGRERNGHQLWAGGGYKAAVMTEPGGDAVASASISAKS